MSPDWLAALVCASLASYLAHSTLLLGAAWILTRRLPPRFDRMAELAWRLALGLPVVTAVLGRLAPARATALNGSSLQYAPPAMTVAAVPIFVWYFIAVLWIAGAIVGITQLAMMYRSLRRTIARRTTIAPQQFGALASLRGMESTRLSVVADLSVPLALRNEICLPAWVVDGMDLDEYRAVIAHELAHVRRGDAIWRPLAAIVTRIFFVQPLNWVASARLRELSECICDEEAIEATESALPLASALEAVAVRNSRRSPHMVLVPAMDAGKSFTLKRVVRILSSSPRVRLRGSTAWLRTLGVAAVIVGAVVAPRLVVPATAFQRYTINAVDPAGHFTLTVERGRVVAGTLGGRSLAPAQVNQRGSLVTIVDRAGEPLSLRITPQGGISWKARKSAD